MSEPVQILSMEIGTAFGDLAQTAAALEASQTALAALDDLGYPDRHGARMHGLADFDDDPALRILGRHGRALEPVLRAAHANGGGARVQRERIGLFLALGMVDAEPDDLVPAVRASLDSEGEFQLERFFGGAFRSIHPLWPLAMLNNVAGGQFAIDLDIRGDNLVLASDADGGVRALLEAARSIQAGVCDAALVAGASETVGTFGVARRALEGRTTEDAQGEGCGAWLLASAACAASIGAKPRGFLRGGATVFDCAGRRGHAEARAVHEALRDAGMEDDDFAGTTNEVVNQQQLGALGPAAAFVLGTYALLGAPTPIAVAVSAPSGAAGALILEAA